MPERISDQRQSLMSRLLKPQYVMVYATVGIFILIYIYGAVRFGSIGFTTLRTFINMFKDNAYYGISAIGMTMVLITGGIDLSVASVACLTGMIVAYGTSVLGYHPALCMVFAMVVGVGLGLLQGAAIHYLNVPPSLHHHSGGQLPCPRCMLPNQP